MLQTYKSRKADLIVRFHLTERQAEVGQVVQATMPIFSLAVDGDRDGRRDPREAVRVHRPVPAEAHDQGRPQITGFA